MKKIAGIIGLVFAFNGFGNCQLYSPECVFLHLDRQVYISGEKICFKAYLFDENSGIYPVQSSILYLQLSDPEQKVLLVRSDVEENGTSYGQIVLPDSLVTGLYYLTAYTNCMRNYNPELLISVPLIVINPYDENINSLIYFPSFNNDRYKDYDANDQKSVAGCEITTSKKVYGKREKVIASIKLKGMPDTSSTANVSLTVTEQIPSYNLLNGYLNIQNYLQLFSHNLLKNKGQTDLEKNIQKCRYIREKGGYILTGTVFDSSSGKVFPDACVLLSTPDTVANLKYSFTDSIGKFSFLLDKCYNNKDLILQIKNPFQSLKNAGIEIDEKSIGKIYSHFDKIPIDDSLKSYLNNCRKIALIKKAYQKTTESEEITGKNNCMVSGYDFFGEPDKIIYPSDFTDLLDFHEILANIISGVKYKQREDSTYYVQLLNDDTHAYMNETDVMVFLNNIPIFDYSILKHLNTRQLNQVKIRYKMMMYGDLRISGVLSLNTGEDYFPLLLFSGKINLVKNTVISRNKGIISYDYEDKDKKYSKPPDLRQTLYWNPEIKIGKEAVVVEFCTSDIKATYDINIQGITTKGAPISSTARFSVR
jgi:hypothetical protein